MDLDDQIKLGHLLLNERRCRVCGQTKNLIDSFYKIRKDKKHLLSSYSYECKDCTIKRVIESRNDKPDMPYDPVPRTKDVYPDW